MKDKILLFIPAYNCEKQITRVLASLDNSKVTDYITEIIVVNNLSTDNTEKTAVSFAKKHTKLPIKILRNQSNYGLGGSHKVAFKYAIENNFDYIITLHGDNQGNINDILPILEDLSYRNHDCCLGSRFMKGSHLKNYSKERIFANYVFNLMYSLLLWRKIYDMGSGLNMYKVKSLKKILPDLLLLNDTLSFNCDMLCLMAYSKIDFTFFPISWSETDQVSNVKLIKTTYEIIKLPILYLLRVRPNKTSTCRKYNYNIINKC